MGDLKQEKRNGQFARAARTESNAQTEVLLSSCPLSDQKFVERQAQHKCAHSFLRITTKSTYSSTVSHIEMSHTEQADGQKHWLLIDRVWLCSYPSVRLDGGVCVMTEVGEGMVGCRPS